MLFYLFLGFVRLFDDFFRELLFGFVVFIVGISRGFLGFRFLLVVVAFLWVFYRSPGQNKIHLLLQWLNDLKLFFAWFSH